MAWSIWKLWHEWDLSSSSSARGTLALRVSSWLSCILLLVVLQGCGRRDEVIANVSVPIPKGMEKIPDKTFVPIPGFEDGQASYQGKVGRGDIFTFYQEVMGAKGWTPITFFADQKDRLTYTKDNRALMIWHHQDSDGTTLLTIMVGSANPPK